MKHILYPVLIGLGMILFALGLSAQIPIEEVSTPVSADSALVVQTPATDTVTALPKPDIPPQKLDYFADFREFIKWFSIAIIAILAFSLIRSYQIKKRMKNETAKPQNQAGSKLPRQINRASPSPTSS